MTPQVQPDPQDHGHEVMVTGPDVALKANLAVPEAARGVVVFAHGTGSDRHSPRNNHVARRLGEHGLATLVMDLLTGDEQRLDAAGVSRQPDIPSLGERVAGAVDWLAAQRTTADLPVGLFGASTGAAVVLIAAASRPDRVRAVVCRGGRPDLARPVLPEVTCPVDLIVGEHDPPVGELSHEAADRLSGRASVEMIAGASHLFEEPGALEQVAERTADWFGEHLTGR